MPWFSKPVRSRLPVIAQRFWVARYWSESVNFRVLSSLKCSSLLMMNCPPFWAWRIVWPSAE